MKTSIITFVLLSSINVFASEVGEDKKSDCAFIDQSSKREAKVIASTGEAEDKKEQSRNVSK